MELKNGRYAKTEDRNCVIRQLFRKFSLIRDVQHLNQKLLGTVFLFNNFPNSVVIKGLKRKIACPHLGFFQFNCQFTNIDQKMIEIGIHLHIDRRTVFRGQESTVIIIATPESPNRQQRFQHTIDMEDVKKRSELRSENEIVINRQFSVLPLRLPKWKKFRFRHSLDQPASHIEVRWSGFNGGTCLQFDLVELLKY